MNLTPSAIQQFFTNDGRPAAGFKLFTYAAGTTTKIATYTDSSGSLNTNPIILNFRGEARIWLDPTLSYKFTFAPSTDTDPPTSPIWTVDNITVGAASRDNAAQDTGSANTVRLAIPLLSGTPAIFDRIVWRSAFTNTGATTIVINGGLTKNLTWQNQAAIQATTILLNGIYEAIYDGTEWQLQGPTLGPLEQITADEIAAMVSPLLYGNLPGDINRYGASPSASAATNATAINAALAANKYVFCTTPGTYSVGATMNAKTNQTVFFSEGITFQASVRDWSGQGFFRIDSISNFQLYGGIFDGNKANNPAGNCIGILMLASDNVRCFGVTAKNFPSDNVTLGSQGDGFYMGNTGTTICKNIELINCYSTANVRQGLSLVQADGVAVIGGRYSETTGNNPGAGIDVEADPGVGDVRNIRIIGVELLNNEKGLVLTESSFNVTVQGCVIRGSRGCSLLLSDPTDATIVGNLIDAGPQTIDMPIIDIPGATNVLITGNTIIGDGAASSHEGAAIRFAIGSVDVNIIGNFFRNTRLQVLSLGNSALSGIPTRINFSGNKMIDCVDTAAFPAAAVIGIGGNTVSAKYPVNVTCRNNVIQDSRGTPAAVAIDLVNIPAATSANYKIGDNVVQGPTLAFRDNIAIVPPLCGQVGWNPANLVDGAGETSPNCTVLGAALGDSVQVFPPYSLQGMVYSGYVSAADTVVIRIQNETGGAIDLANGGWQVRVTKLLSL